MRRSRRLRFPAVFAAVLLAGLLAAPLAPVARAADQCFPQTGFCVPAVFLAYWQAHGGLAINGYPISDAHTETLENGKPYYVQYFERVRMEYHPEISDPQYQVLLGQFGRLLYPIHADAPLATKAAQLPGATYFTQTGHNLAGAFRDYWNANGGLAQFGFPLSEEFQEQLEDGKVYRVQYFERARFEFHPENADPAYRILLGQFGRRILAARSGASQALPFPVTGSIGQVYTGSADVRARLYLPTAAQTQVQGAIQAFQHGFMLWRGDSKTIYVLAADPGAFGTPGQWLAFPDTWAEGQPAGGGPVPGTPYFLPKRGFGKVWRDHGNVQQLLGYALTADEQGLTMPVQPFVAGLALVDEQGNRQYYRPGAVYLVYTNGRWESYYLQRQP
ncbi:MAG TPA: hypothetical protein VFW96_13175 [Thermomicrobiales bacterium]|nr:hypothetical protein [Thermomicrobiales bacterium]